jgi:hypothetical protein
MGKFITDLSSITTVGLDLAKHDAVDGYDCPSNHRLIANNLLQLLEQVARGVIVEMIGPVPYQEHCAHSKTVTYDTMLMTVRGQD